MSLWIFENNTDCESLTASKSLLSFLKLRSFLSRLAAVSRNRLPIFNTVSSSRLATFEVIRCFARWIGSEWPIVSSMYLNKKGEVIAWSASSVLEISTETRTSGRMILKTLDSRKFEETACCRTVPTTPADVAVPLTATVFTLILRSLTIQYSLAWHNVSGAEKNLNHTTDRFPGTSEGNACWLSDTKFKETIDRASNDRLHRPVRSKC